jgi:F0F1-type ATP synthase assembly protein I
MQYALKILISALVLVAVSELAKRSSVAGALLASLPLTSILAFVWLYADTRETGQVAALSTGIFWLVLPSLVLFLVLPALLRQGWGFWPGLGAAMAATVVAYLAMLALLPRLGIEL